MATDDAQEFAAQVIRLLQDGDLRVSLARKARVAAEANYGWDRHLAQLDRVVAAVT